jgi:hypothetical protein
VKNRRDNCVVWGRRVWPVVLVMASNVLLAQEITIQIREDTEVDLAHTKTYGWASQVDHALDAGNYFLNDIVLKTDIKDAVREELEARGYRQESTSADIIVNFRVFDEPVVLSGYEGYGAAYWGDVEFQVPADSANTELDAGTLIISIIDRRAGRLVWQGFASGLMENNKFVKDEGKIRNAVNLVFEKYNYRASEYTKR